MATKQPLDPFLPDNEFIELTALCDALLPSLPRLATTGDEHLDAYWRRKASDLNIPSHVSRTMHEYLYPEPLADLRLFLRLLSSSVTALPLTGRFSRFSALTSEQQERALLSWSLSAIPKFRAAFNGVKRLAASLFYSVVEDGATSNPNWGVLGFPGGSLVASVSDRAPATLVRQELPSEASADKPHVITVDVVVVGTGCGGGPVAAKLAAAGHSVLCIDKGPYMSEKDFDGLEAPGFQRMYDNAAILTSEDGAMSVLAGSVVGGGSVINWSASFRTPDGVLKEWETEHGLPTLNSDEFRAAIDAVWKRSSVDKHKSSQKFNQSNGLLRRGCKAMGWHVDEVMNNTKGCVDCGACNFGCVYGAKQSTMKTYLQDACDSGNCTILPDTYVERVLINDAGDATGVLATARTTAGTSVAVRVDASIVVVSAGAIQSPALLLRSKVGNKNIGRHLYLHPVTAVVPLWEDPDKEYDTGVWKGPPLVTVTNQFADLDGNGYGAKLENPAVQPGLMTGAAPWHGSEWFKSLVLEMPKLSPLVVLVRDADSGHVKIDAAGRPRIHYALSSRDAKHLRTAMVGAARLAYAGGAREILVTMSSVPPFKDDGTPGCFDRWLKRLEASGHRTNDLSLFSAHQMGTCRMGKSKAAGVVRPSGESWDVRNLFVSDASVFPTSSGVNPMITTMAFGEFISTHVLQRIEALKRRKGSSRRASRR